VERFEIMHGMDMDANVNGNPGEAAAEVMFELRIEEVEQLGENQDQALDEDEIRIEFNVNEVEGQRAPQAEEAVNRAVDGPEPAPEAMDAQVNEVANAAEGQGQGQNQVQHEAPQAPPARRMGLGALLSSISNAVVGALILPGVSFAMGEALRLVLPKTWTSSSARNPWTLYGGFGGRPGLLQQQWGRSLVGGCLYVVLKDVIRVYAKSRRVVAMGNRRVKNVDRKRAGR
jgi:hypothetical protein